MIEATGEREAGDTGRSESIWDPTYRGLTIGIMLTIAGAAFEALAVATTLPATADELQGLALYGWVFSAFMLTNLVSIIVAGGEADRQGPARPFAIGVGLFTIGLVIAGLAQSMPMLIAARAVQGFGAGAISAVAYVAVGRGYPAALKPRMLAIISSAWVIPGLIGPGVAGIISDYLGWRWVFLGLVPLPIVAAILAWRSMAQLTASSAAPIAWRRIATAAQLALGAALVVAGLGSPVLRAVPLLGVGALLALPALRQLLPTGTLRAAAGTPAAILTNGLLSMAFFGVDAFVPLALTEIRLQTAAVAGLSLTAATITWTTGSWLQARYAPTESRRRLVRIGLIILLAGVACTAAMLLPTVPAALAPFAWGLAGLGIGLAFSTLTLVVLETAPPGEEGVASSALQLMNNLGTALGTGIGGVIIGAHAGEAPPAGRIALQDALMFGVLVLALGLTVRLPGKPGETTT